ncbi:glycolate oxidase subunit GlcF [Marinibaculum pumilum]|uniref:Glycolate oxidase iron-sulfur subunit n=1 Tax=Marinibaculum pumilum TaxID=1766165 RepID=A0ABV7L6J1_9PROT
MQTHFSLAQLADPATRESEQILRNCVHCGFCTATCPTYVLLGDERDSPRGRIYLIKEMLEGGGTPDPATVTHIDRCLSCLSCMTTCPSGVHYMHLVDHGRAYVQEHYRRPVAERALRALLAAVLPRPGLFRLAMRGASLARLGRGLLPRGGALAARLRAMLELAPEALPPAQALPGGSVFPAEGPRRRRVALLAGCVQQTLAPQINAATIRLLTRHGCEVVVPDGLGCCGALVHHLGREADAHAAARANVRALRRAEAAGAFDALLVNASGCGTMLKDYGFLLREDPELAGAAADLAARTRDISEFCAAGAAEGLDLSAARAPRPLRVAYHAACSLQHGQKVVAAPRRLLADAGFELREIAEGHLCCGSAGTYNILQPELAGRLRDRKAGHVGRTGADVLATGNIGCLTQLAPVLEMPAVHTVELLDWATGGPAPAGLDLVAGPLAAAG